MLASDFCSLCDSEVRAALLASHACGSTAAVLPTSSLAGCPRLANMPAPAAPRHTIPKLELLLANKASPPTATRPLLPRPLQKQKGDMGCLSLFGAPRVQPLNDYRLLYFVKKCLDAYMVSGWL